MTGKEAEAVKTNICDGTQRKARWGEIMVSTLDVMDSTLEAMVSTLEAMVSTLEAMVSTLENDVRSLKGDNPKSILRSLCLSSSSSTSSAFRATYKRIERIT